MTAPRTINGLSTSALAADPARPALTFYDDATGERTELSGATLANWIAKTANMLVDDCGLGPGDLAAACLPPHWQSAAVLLGCWAAGLAVAVEPAREPAAGSAKDAAAGSAPADVAFISATLVEADGSGGWTLAEGAADRYVLGLHPLGLPLPSAPDGYLDYNAEVRAHADHFSTQPVTPDDLAMPGLTHARACQLAVERAETLGIEGRVLIDAGSHSDPMDWLLAPLAAGASTVLCANLDRSKIDARVAAERVTRVIR